MTCSLLPEEQFSEAWRLVVDNTFPRIALAQNESHLTSFVDLGEHLFVENLLRSQVNPSIRLIPVQRSVYELAALVLHAFDRAETPFNVIDFLSEEVSFVPPFSFDHKSRVSRTTSQHLLAAVDKALSHSALLKVASNINLVLLCGLIHLHAGLPISSTMELDIENASFTGTADQMSAFFACEINPLAIIFVDDLSLAERGKSTDLSLKLDRWPLTSPFLIDIVDEMFEDAEKSEDLVLSLVASLLDDVRSLTDLIASQTSESLEKARQKLWEMQLRCTKDGEEMYGRLCALFCPELTTTETLPTKHSDLKRFLAQIDPVRRTDPFIASTRIPGFFSEFKEMLKRALDAEKCAGRSEASFDETFLYRGSMDMSHESLSTNSVAFASPEQYGLLLGCSTDYREIALSNPHNAHSMSFGSSLFAGLLYDPTASVWTYWASQTVKNGYIIRIPIDEHLLRRMRKDLSATDPSTAPKDLIPEDAKDTAPSTDTRSHWSDWFFIPPVPAILALAGSGELWHARSKCALPTSARDSTFSFVSGVLSCSYRRVPDFLLMLDQEPPTFSSLPVYHIKPDPKC